MEFFQINIDSLIARLYALASHHVVVLGIGGSLSSFIVAKFKKQAIFFLAVNVFLWVRLLDNLTVVNVRSITHQRKALANELPSDMLCLMELLTVKLLLVFSIFPP